MERARRILIIENCADAREMYGIIFLLAGYEVHEAGSVAAGIAAVDDCEPDVLVADLRLRDGSGAEVLAHVRAKGLRTHAVALTGIATPDARRRALEAGFAQFIVKPCAPDDLVAYVERGSHVVPSGHAAFTDYLVA